MAKIEDLVDVFTSLPKTDPGLAKEPSYDLSIWSNEGNDLTFRIQYVVPTWTLVGDKSKFSEIKCYRIYEEILMLNLPPRPQFWQGRSFYRQGQQEAFRLVRLTKALLSLNGLLPP